MADGWIKLHRKIIETDGYFSEPFCRNMAWVDLLLLANHDANFFRVRGVRVDVQRGQCGHSEETLGERWKWSRGKVRRFLNDLEKDMKIVQQKSRVINLITIVKYEDYQKDGTTKRTTGSTTDGHQTVQQTDTNKNVKNVKNDKKGEAAPLSPEQLAEFEKFQEWVKTKASSVSQMREPFTIDQFFEIKEKFAAAKISEVLQNMHNWQPLLKKNKSAYLTLLKWIKKDQQNGTVSKPSTGSSKQQGANQLLDSLKTDLEFAAGGVFNP